MATFRALEGLDAVTPRISVARQGFCATRRNVGFRAKKGVVGSTRQDKCESFASIMWKAPVLA